MAFQLALGCKVVGYDLVHRSCCNNVDASTCSDCVSPESVVVGGSSGTTGPGNCNPGFDIVDGTYAIPTSFDTSCAETSNIYFQNCTSPTYTYTINWSVSAYGYGLVPMPFTTLPTPGSVVIPYPYTSGMRVAVVVLYAISTTVQDYHYYVADFETCPQGTQNIPFIVTVRFDSSSGSLLLNSSPPTTIQLVFPTP